MKQYFTHSDLSPAFIRRRFLGSANAQHEFYALPTYHLHSHYELRTIVYPISLSKRSHDLLDMLVPLTEIIETKMEKKTTIRVA